MVIETPEGLTLVEPAENSSFYIVQEHEGQETPPGTYKVLRLKPFLESSGSPSYCFILVSIATVQDALLGYIFIVTCRLFTVPYFSVRS